MKLGIALFMEPVVSRKMSMFMVFVYWCSTLFVDTSKESGISRILSFVIKSVSNIV